MWLHRLGSWHLFFMYIQYRRMYIIVVFKLMWLYSWPAVIALFLAQTLCTQSVHCHFLCVCVCMFDVQRVALPMLVTSELPFHTAGFCNVSYAVVSLILVPFLSSICCASLLTRCSSRLTATRHSWLLTSLLSISHYSIFDWYLRNVCAVDESDVRSAVGGVRRTKSSPCMQTRPQTSVTSRPPFYYRT